MKSAIKDHDLSDLLAPWTTETTNKIRNVSAQLFSSFRTMVSPGGQITEEDRRQIDKVNKDVTKLFSVDNVLEATGIIRIAEESMDQFMVYTDRRADEEIRSLTQGYQTPRQRSGLRKGDFRTNR